MTFEIAMFDCNLAMLSSISSSLFWKMCTYLLHGEPFLRKYLRRKQITGAIRVELSEGLAIVQGALGFDGTKPSG